MNFSKKTLGFVALLMVALMTTGCFGIFDKDEGDFTITATVNDSKMGEVTGVDSGYDKDAVTEITAVAKPGYIFSHWEGVDEEFAKDNPLRITVTEDLEIEAVFEVDENFTIQSYDATDDTFIRLDWDSPTNHGNKERLEIKFDMNAPEDMGSSRISFLKFDIDEWSAIYSATFRIFAEADSENGTPDTITIAVYDVTGEDEWTQSELTGENASEDLIYGGTKITEFDAPGHNEAEEWYEVDLTELVADYASEGTTEISLRLESVTNHFKLVYFTSSEGREDTRPELVVVGNK